MEDWRHEHNILQEVDFEILVIMSIDVISERLYLTWAENFKLLTSKIFFFVFDQNYQNEHFCYRNVYRNFDHI